MYKTKYLSILKSFLLSKEYEFELEDEVLEGLNKYFNEAKKNKLHFNKQASFIEFLVIYFFLDFKKDILFITSNKEIEKQITYFYLKIGNLIFGEKISAPVFHVMENVVKKNESSIEFIYSSAYILNKKKKYDLIIYYDYELLNRDKIMRDIAEVRSKVLFVIDKMMYDINLKEIKKEIKK